MGSTPICTGTTSLPLHTKLHICEGLNCRVNKQPMTNDCCVKINPICISIMMLICIIHMLQHIFLCHLIYISLSHPAKGMVRDQMHFLSDGITCHVPSCVTVGPLHVQCVKWSFKLEGVTSKNIYTTKRTYRLVLC